jgi:hypothetical protein
LGTQAPAICGRSERYHGFNIAAAPTDGRVLGAYKAEGDRVNYQLTDAAIERAAQSEGERQGEGLEIGLYPMKTLENGDQTLAENSEEIEFYDVDIRPDGGDPFEEFDNLTEAQANAMVSALEQRYPDAGVSDLRDLLP